MDDMVTWTKGHVLKLQPSSKIDTRKLLRHHIGEKQHCVAYTLTSSFTKHLQTLPVTFEEIPSPMISISDFLMTSPLNRTQEKKKRKKH